MSLFRPLVVLGGVGILGVAMVGVGAGVTFTDTTHSLQTITTGSINMNLSSTDPTLVGTGTMDAHPPLPWTGWLGFQDRIGADHDDEQRQGDGDGDVHQREYHPAVRVCASPMPR